MRGIEQGNVLSLRAVAGLHVVTLAWDFADGLDAKKAGLLGFAIERSELDAQGEVVERYWLRGIKRFKLKDEGLPPGTPVPTSEHPIQSFQWGDYTAKPATTYRYRLVPAYGKPKLLDLDDALSVTVEITTEREQADATAPDPRHDVYFNRGVAGSQAYARKFGKTQPDPDKPDSEQMQWLSRGLFEALRAFIGRAKSKDFALRAMLYEFRYEPVGLLFKEAAEREADVDVRYEAQSYIEDNEKMIEDAGIRGICTPQKSRDGIRHNKFIVLLEKGKPVAVWTGSTNISAGGIFGHSNVGHIVWDRDIADLYLAYWKRLTAAPKEVTTGKLRAKNLEVEATPEPGDEPPSDRILVLFSPRDPESKVAGPTLAWYADRLRAAEKITCMTVAFNFDPVFEKVVAGKTKALNYLVFDKSPDPAAADEIQHAENTVIAVGSKLAKGDMENFIGEVLTGFNNNLYIHDKFMLLDPLGKDPVVITGTANFSTRSQWANDENMLIIRGDTRVADVYFGEFMRIFDHHYSRYVIQLLKAKGQNDPDAGFLKESTQDWLPAHFRPGRKSTRRVNFMG